MTIMKKSRQLEVKSSAQPQLFSKFRDLGLVCDDVPFSISTPGGVAFAVCSVGYTYHVYSMEKLELTFVGPLFDEKITALATWKDCTLVAIPGSIVLVDRNVEVARVTLKDEVFSKLLVLDDLLIASSGSSLFVFNLSHKLSLSHKEKFESGIIVTVIHPETYLNKVLIAFADGTLLLFNTKTMRRIHEFAELSSQRLTAISPTPDPDIVCAGFVDGSVAFLELKKAQLLFKLKIDGAVCALSFRTDDRAHLAVGSVLGDIFVFDLDSRKLDCIMRAHSRKVSALWFVPRQPLLLSASADNSLKQHLYESNEYRALKQRSGHYKDSRIVQFLGEDGRFLVSAGMDRSLRFFSTTKDNQAFEFSQGSIERVASKLKVEQEEIKLPEITSFDIFEIKSLRWDNMVTAHAGQSYVRTWRLDHKALGSHILSTPDKSVVTHVSISSCGNYVLASSASGKVFVFNLQSGILRKTLNIADEPLVASFTDSTSSFVMSVSKSGTVSQFSLSSASLVAVLTLESGAAAAVVNRDGEMIAVAGADHTIRVVDYAVMRTVRLLQGHCALVSDMVFSSDSKWLLSASHDKTIKTWDLPTGKLLDSVSTRSAPLSISFSRNLEFLASSHENEASISIWANRSLFAGDCFSAESSWAASTLPLATVSPSDSEVVFSGFPPSRWKNIYFLEKIRANTKPIAAMAAKKSALPFFLGQALQQELNTSGFAMREKEETTVKVSTEAFTATLDSCMESDSCLVLANHLLELQPSALDMEISCLEVDKKVQRLVFMLRSLSAAISQGTNFELLLATVSVVFRHHDVFIGDNLSAFAEALHELDSAIGGKWEPLEGLAQQCLCSIQFIREN